MPILVFAVSQTAALIHAIIYSWRHFGKMLCLYVAVSALSTACEEKTRALTVSADQSVEGSCGSASAGFFCDGFPESCAESRLIAVAEQTAQFIFTGVTCCV